MSEGRDEMNKVSVAIRLARVIEINKSRIERLEAKLKEIESEMSESELKEYKREVERFARAFRRRFERS